MSSPHRVHNRLDELLIPERTISLLPRIYRKVSGHYPEGGRQQERAGPGEGRGRWELPNYVAPADNGVHHGSEAFTAELHDCRTV